ncbi:Gfo/Idh/MocA family protein [Streptomyces sp. NPDC007818]|uniref:Gfo/Idh/MocA family protein n=1 Tax=Streptomyces sp. NPDC007818 TaxID=3364780 RepID=UPI0036781AB5
MSKQITLAVVGAGNRGAAYTRIARATGLGRVVAVAEPREPRRTAMASRHAVEPALVVDDWRKLADRPRVADAVVIATQDADHVEPAVRFAELGYDVLLEKPMATSEADCERIVAAAEKSGALFAVCHVLRYTPYTRTLKALVDSGRIGDVVSVEHLEPVGWHHQAHSFVRGNWRREDLGSSMLMAKSCHDIDWLAHIVGRKAVRVSSFGSLYHFRPENRPAGAADRCLDCGVEEGCPYSAKKLYMPALASATPDSWPLAVITDDLSEAGVLRALEMGPYGRCVYACDNDVVDHQVVALEYEGGVTASFTMTAFTPSAHRKTRLFGTHGYIESDGVTLRVQDFRTGEWETVDTRAAADATAAGGHGGGDHALVTAFLEAVRSRDTSRILSGARESLDTHRVVWAAERSRTTGETVTLS